MIKMLPARDAATAVHLSCDAWSHQTTSTAKCSGPGEGALQTCASLLPEENQVAALVPTPSSCAAQGQDRRREGCASAGTPWAHRELKVAPQIAWVARADLSGGHMAALLAGLDDGPQLLGGGDLHHRGAGHHHHALGVLLDLQLRALPRLQTNMVLVLEMS